jgi:Rps23 Pro-64 3,4-dihydroxylase Tpa1-like proline 4-hydroxylase
MWKTLDSLFTVRSFRFPLGLFLFSLTFLLYTLISSPYQSDLYQKLPSSSAATSSSSSSEGDNQMILLGSSHKKLSSKYLIEYHNWMMVLNTSIARKLDKYMSDSSSEDTSHASGGKQPSGVLPPPSSLSSLSQHFQSSQPFPHLVLDSLIPQSILNEILKEFPEDPVVQHVNNNLHHHGQMKLRHPESYGPATAALYTFFQSPYVISYLEHLTGIPHLIPGDYTLGSGLHQTLSNGFLDLHADYNRPRSVPELNDQIFYRRVNLYIFFNPDWEEKYGGYLEFWPKDLSQCQQRILPTLGRVVIFTSTDHTYHGHPQKLSCPKSRSRRSLTLYYYTKTRPAGEDCSSKDCLHEKKKSNFIKPKCQCGEKLCGEELMNGRGIIDLGMGSAHE